ncbi:hypothetical protein HDE_02198 [Halotydeus destructor]|nr:hypothetical protein HDE_02198 [Halotydeus destructor]
MKAAILLIALVNSIQPGQSLDCYDCVSGGIMPYNEKCDRGSWWSYGSKQENCMPQDAAAGQTAAHVHCVKVVGTDTGSQTTIVMRGCSSSYREGCREQINFRGRQVNGCIFSCRDKDYCNHGSSLAVPLVAILSSTLLLLGVKFI